MKKTIPSYMYIVITLVLSVIFLVYVASQTQDRLKGRERDLQEIAVSIGLDGEKFQQDFLSQEVRDKAFAYNQEAVTRGINSTPTILINGAPVQAREFEDVVSQVNVLLEDESITGNIVIEEFFDYQCGVCASYHSTILSIQEEFIGNDRVEVRKVPMFLGTFVEEISQAYTFAYLAAENQGKGLEMDVQIYLYHHGQTIYNSTVTNGIVESINSKLQL